MKKMQYYPVRYVKNIRELVKSSLDSNPNAPAFWVKKDKVYKPITYKEFYDDFNNLGSALLRDGLLGKKFVIIGENRYEWAVSYVAVVCGLGICVPFDKELPDEEMQMLLEEGDADVIIYSPKVKEKVERVIKDFDKDIRLFDMDEDIPMLIEEGKNFGTKEYRELPIDEKKMSVLLFTSGTTGIAKGVMLSHENICENIINMCKMCIIYPEDIFLSVLPLHHTYECTCGFLCVLYCKASIAYCEGIRHIPKNIIESKATIMLAVPLILESIYNRIWKTAKKNGKEKALKNAIKLNNISKKMGIDMSKKLFAEIHKSLGKIRIFITGAAPIDPEVVKGFNDFNILILQGYGLTECSPIAALNHEHNSNPYSAGLTLSGSEIKIDSPDENGNGEILIKGKNVMLGYYNNPEATKEALRDGWFHSGDIGHFDEDGFLIITGRKKNVILTKNGKNVYPEELETYLSRSPYISQCLVYQKSTDDDTFIATQLILDEEAMRSHFGGEYSESEANELIKSEIDSINDKVQPFKRIEEFKIRTEPFKMTTTNKIKRHLENTNE